MAALLLTDGLVDNRAISLMRKARLYRFSALACAIVTIAGCKIIDDPVDDAATGEASTGNAAGGSTSPPSIWGKPDTAVFVNTQYLFAPDADDADGDVLEYGIVNQPAWAEFDRYSGTLQGVPGSNDLGPHAKIVISVTDGSSVVSLPSFSITVKSADDSSGGDDANGPTPPTISGSPSTAAVVDKKYSFQPDASDADGDDLSFSIVNKPSWATFATSSGLLEGQPQSTDVGTSEPIEISVTDGTSIAALEKFSITVTSVGSASFTILWTPPTENEDGSPLTDLAGYRIYYGTSSANYSEVIEIDNPGLTSYSIDGLAPGTYFLAMTSVNSHNIESPKTPELELATGS